MKMTFEDILAAADTDEVRALDLSCFGEDDLLNIILQRSEVIWRAGERNHAVLGWMNGDETLLRAQVQKLGRDIAMRAAAIAMLEWQDAQELLDAADARPARIADIGCGYGMSDLFALRAGAASVLLIDIEDGDARVFGYEREGAAYSNLAVARAFLEANGIAPGAIATCNPRAEDLGAAGQVDLAVSLLSCGFHYPADTYSDFYRDGVREDGHVMLDVRTNAHADQKPALDAIGPEVARSEGRKFARVLHRRG